MEREKGESKSLVFIVKFGIGSRNLWLLGWWFFFFGVVWEVAIFLEKLGVE